MVHKVRWFRILSASLILAVALANLPLAAISPFRVSAQTETVFINEIHYDNTGTDAGEAIEIAGPAGTDLTGWSLVLYNGSGGAVYDTDLLSGIIPDLQNGFGVLTFNYAVNGIQNGSPDGIALVDPSNTVIQFLSYEGTFTAVGGAANGMLSVDIGVSEPGSDPLGNSLQLTGTGSLYGNFIWAASQANTFGAVNTGQTFEGGVVGPADPKLNEFSASTAGTDVEFVEIFGDANTDYSTYKILEIEGDSGTVSGTVDEVIAIGTTDANGLWLGSLPANALENGSITLLVVKDFTGAAGADLDTNDDGVFDATPWSAIVDAVAVNDGGASDPAYGVPVLGVSYDGLAFAPGGASRIPDGFDTDAATDWVRNDFDLAGIPGFIGTPIVGEAYNTPGALNQVFTPPPFEPGICGDAFTPIYEVQGPGAESPLVGELVSVEGVVVGDFQNNASADNGDLNGFHIQDTAGDGDAATSDGIFIYAPGAVDVIVGQTVRASGTVAEFNGMTEISTGDYPVQGCSTDPVTIDPTVVSLPAASLDAFEAYEGMLITFPQALVISEYFNFDRFNEIVLTSERHLTPTAEFEPGSPEAYQAMLEFELDSITLDDGRTPQNPDPALHPNGSVFDLTNLFRGGDTVSNVTGVIDYSFGLYRVQPTQGADYVNANPRPALPEEVGGNLKVAAFNVLNYFDTLSSEQCGPPGFEQQCRGADTPEEFARQQAKIVSALASINADIFGLIEIENDAGEATANLVAALNDVVGAGTYTYVNTDFIGTDVIKQAFIYKPATVSLLGDYALLTSAVDPRFNDDHNRPVLAQTFMDNSTGGVVTVAVNHLKSKGSACLGDPDLGDGAGNCNLTRLAAAQAMVDWLAADPTGSGDSDFLIIGDLNSYDKEDPIDAIKAGADDTSGTADDYTDLIFQFQGEAAYSYVFDGQIGYLDHALASAGLVPDVSGTTVWHINADEPDLIDYDMTFKQDAQDAIFAPDAYRSSDHDPVIVGLNLLSYDFSGFFQPVDNAPVFNSVKGGSSIPVKFSLAGDQGLDIFYTGYPASEQIACDSSAPIDNVEQTVTAGESSLSYDPTTDQYIYVWKTDKAWAGTCRQLVMVLKDGSIHYAYFRFK